jgi:hypothetical protein
MKSQILIMVAAGAGIFLLGALMAYWIVGIRIRSLLKGERPKSPKASAPEWWKTHFRFLLLVDELKKRMEYFRLERENLIHSLKEEKRLAESDRQKIGDLRTRLAEKERQVRELERIIRGPEGKTAGGKLKPTGGREPESQRSAPNAFYFGLPDSDGNFSVENGVPAPDDRKIYRIVPDREGETGELHYISGQSDPKAIDNIDYYLIPVCDVENIPDRNSATRIYQKEPGRVVRISGKWVTDRKIKIKLL